MGISALLVGYRDETALALFAFIAFEQYLVNIVAWGNEPIVVSPSVPEQLVTAAEQRAVLEAAERAGSYGIPTVIASGDEGLDELSLAGGNELADALATKEAGTAK